MTDYDADHDGDQTTGEDIWIPLWDSRATVPCLFIAAVAAGAWILTQLLMH
jgi:hypothetical protein